MMISQAPCFRARSDTCNLVFAYSLGYPNLLLISPPPDGFRVKEIRVFQSVRFLILILAASTMAAAIGFSGSIAEAKTGKKGSVEVGFLASPPPGFQNVLLNVTG